MKWPLTFYTNSMPDPFDGYAIGPVILLRPENKNDEPLYLHEVQHVKQFWWATVASLAVISAAWFGAYHLGHLPLPTDGLFSIISAVALVVLAFSTHRLLYQFRRKYRLWAEATAYAVQARAGDDLDHLAGFMARSVYRLDITRGRARREIKSYI